MTSIELGKYAVDTAYTVFLWWLAFRSIRGLAKIVAQELSK